MKTSRHMFAWIAGVLFLLWLVFHFRSITADDDGIIRLVLVSLFSGILMLRWKPKGQAREIPGPVLAGLALAGALGAVIGIIIPIHQIEWLGIILLLFACLCWASPPDASRDIGLAMFLLYWIHPLPGQLFAKFHLAMQFLSVRGAEWFLHVLNIRVWADGFILHTVQYAFGVPESCSGMRTAMVVSLCVLGVGFLLRLKTLEILIFFLLGLAQTLILNILRIAFLVAWSPRMSIDWAGTFLHDTAGIFLLVTILLVQIEISCWKVRQFRRRELERNLKNGTVETPDAASTLPRFWQLASSYGRIVLAILLLLAGAGLMVYRHRPEHRAAMIAGIVDGVADRDLAVAEKAMDAALTLTPKNRTFLSRRAYILMRRQKFEEALSTYESLGPLGLEELVLKSWALMALQRPEEAIAVVEQLPPSSLTLPGVAIVRAEYAAKTDDIQTVVRNIVLASNWHLLADRVRGLYHYLATREQWRIIAQCDIPRVPHKSSGEALIAVQAFLKVGNLARAADLMTYVVKKWPQDSSLLTMLAQMDRRLPEGPWEKIFATSFQAGLSSMGVDQLSAGMQYAFGMNRPDLAWLACLRLQQLDPRDPALLLAPARFGDAWFTVYRKQLALPTTSSFATLPLKPLYLCTRGMRPFQSFGNRVPLAGELAEGGMEKTRGKYLALCLEEIARREEGGRMSRRLDMLYPTILIMAGRIEEAHAKLEAMGRQYPGTQNRFLLQRAALHESQGRWEDAYELLWQYRSATSVPDLAAELMMAGVMMNLNMGATALVVVERAGREFPVVTEVGLAKASIWNFFGFAEEALFYLERKGRGRSHEAVALLQATGRFTEAQQLAPVFGLPPPSRMEMERPAFFPPAAELAIAPRWPAPLSNTDMDRSAREEQTRLVTGRSPFVRGLNERTREWYRARGNEISSDSRAWEAIGRHDLEKGMALHRLALLLARQNKKEKALAAAAQSVRFVPDAAIFHRLRISLSDGDYSTVEEAHRNCPEDAEIWLAWLVARSRKEGRGDWALEEITAAATQERFPPAIMVRAGDYLFRAGMLEAADHAALDGVKRGRGLLTAYVLGLRCALEKGDEKRALALALKGANEAADPSPFYKLVVDLKSGGKRLDTDLLLALERLQAQYPGESQWPERLAQVYFQSGDTKRALNVLIPVIDRDAGAVRLQSLMIAAEAARLEGNTAQAAALLESAYSLYPDRLSVLNNLVYNLAQNSKTLARAELLLPKLLRMGTGSFVVMDTAAIVYLNSGRTEQALPYTEKALSLLKADDYAAQEVRLNAARVFLKLGRHEDARRNVETVLANPDRSHLMDIGAKELLKLIEQAASRK